LTKEVGLIREEDIRALNLAEVKALDRKLIRSRHERVQEASNGGSEVAGFVDNVVEAVLLFWLERKTRNLILPCLELF
jgi:hypothetical protein